MYIKAFTIMGRYLIVHKDGNKGLNEVCARKGMWPQAVVSYNVSHSYLYSYRYEWLTLYETTASACGTHFRKD